MPNYKIYPLHVGDLERQKSNLTYMKHPGEVIRFPLICWYVTDGVHSIMVDTGGTPPDGRWQPSFRTPEQDPAAVLEKMGVDRFAVTHVIMTHLHWDHAGNNFLFPNASFYAQRKELEDIKNPCVPIFAGSFDCEQIFKTEYNILDGDCEILDGVRVMLTPGHSAGSQSVIIDTEGGPYLIAGDLIALYECYESNPMIVNGIHIDLVSYYDSLNRVRDSACHVLPGHDYKVFDSNVYPPEK